MQIEPYKIGGGGICGYTKNLWWPTLEKVGLTAIGVKQVQKRSILKVVLASAPVSRRVLKIDLDL